MTTLLNILLGIYVFVSVLMILIILMQRPKSEGLGAAFGGGVTENIFGAQTTNVLTKITGWFAAIFFLLTFVLSILYAHRATSTSNLSSRIEAEPTPVPAISATPVPGASVSPSAIETGTATVSPGPSMASAPSASATTSPGPSAAISVGPATTPAASAKVSAAPSVSASPKQ
ncbi:MAG: preprotein translocase subunit SecG [Verrucomicrobiota bacterium]|nr:preprotein translocase subunit SecG [Verrucomicrobiota bacterium]